MTELCLATNDIHELSIDGKKVILHIPSNSLFELDEQSKDLLVKLKSGPIGEHDFPEYYEAKSDLLKIGVLYKTPIVGRANKPTIAPSALDGALVSLILNVNTGCNLSCTYCYKEDLVKPSEGKQMSFEMAQQSIDMLMVESGAHRNVSVVFFGGEPLSNMSLIREIIPYATAQAGKFGKVVDFSLTTNGTLLTPEIIEFLATNRVGVTISMDGPKALHDKHRLTVSGRGTYDVVAKKVRLLLDLYKVRPVGARVTLTPGVTDVAAIFKHLKNDLGFSEVGFAPVTAGAIETFNLSADELAQIYGAIKLLGELYVDEALKGNYIGFTNMHQLIREIAEGNRKSVPCGAGARLLAVDKAGDLHLCHRFTGSDMPTLGNVKTGVNREAVRTFLIKAVDRDGRGCSTCRVRNYCSGGCYHEAYTRYKDPHHPSYHYCDILRDWYDFGIKSYIKINENNPSYITKYIVRPSSLAEGSAPVAFG